MAYTSDREFTDYVHNHLAVDIIYPKMDWKVQEVKERLSTNIDLNNAVDYMAVDADRNLITIQERFREVKYQNYSDFTIRYMRPENEHEERRLSEFFKMDAEYFIYGTIDVAKKDYKTASKSVKFAVLNLNRLKDRIDDGTIVIDGKLNSYTCVKRDNTMVCPINENYDHSSNFVPFDIAILSNIAPEVIEYQEGFY